MSQDMQRISLLSPGVGIVRMVMAGVGHFVSNREVMGMSATDTANTARSGAGSGGSALVGLGFALGELFGLFDVSDPDGFIQAGRCGGAVVGVAAVFVGFAEQVADHGVGPSAMFQS